MKAEHMPRITPSVKGSPIRSRSALAVRFAHDLETSFDSSTAQEIMVIPIQRHVISFTSADDRIAVYRHSLHAHGARLPARPRNQPPCPSSQKGPPIRLPWPPRSTHRACLGPLSRWFSPAPAPYSLTRPDGVVVAPIRVC